MVGKRILDYADSFAGYMESANVRSRRNLSPRTRQLYSQELVLFARNVDNPLLEDLSPETLLKWNQMLNDAGAAVNTMGAKHNALRHFLSYLEAFPEDKEAEDHARRLLRTATQLGTPTDREPPRKPFVLEEEQVIKMLEAAGKARGGRGVRDRAIIHVLWATGLRCAELADLRLDDLGLSERMANVTGKGSKTRLVVFDAACQADLGKWLEVRAHNRIQSGVDHVFVTVRGRPLSTNDISRTIRAVAKAAGLRKDVWTHVFRHSSITTLLRRGMPLQDVAIFHGHGNVQTTMRYYHQDVTQLRDVYDRATKPRRRGPPARAVEETVLDESVGQDDPSQ